MATSPKIKQETITTEPGDTDPITAAPPALSAADRVRTLYRSEGPYVSVYLAGENGETRQQAWADLQPSLNDQGAPAKALTAIEARLGLPVPPFTAGHGVLAGADGTTIVAHAPEAPLYDIGIVDTLPYVAPLFEWDQRRVPHLVVDITESPTRITTFADTTEDTARTIDGDGDRVAESISVDAAAVAARLVVIIGPQAGGQELADRLVTSLPVDCRVVIEQPPTDEDLADVVVRHVSDTVARTTVANLRDYRFLSAHGDAVDGLTETIDALRRGTAGRVLIHDDPNDQRRIWIGPTPIDLPMEQAGGHTQARLNDALIRSAVLQNIDVYIIPSTGATGPDDNTAALSG